MIIAIMSDIHANLPALNVFVKATKDKVDAYICLGDVVNYGPWNDECLELVYSLPGIVLLEGNHERLFSGKDKIEDELPIVQEFFYNSIKNFSRYDLIDKLPKSYELGSFTCTHTIANQRIYANSILEDDLDCNYIIGHTHHQFRIEHSNKEIVNCGSVGQNRDSIETVNFALYDSKSNTVTMCKEPYSLDMFVKELSGRNYPTHCIDYYTSKLPHQSPEATPPC